MTATCVLCAGYIQHANGRLAGHWSGSQELQLDAVAAEMESQPRNHCPRGFTRTFGIWTDGEHRANTLLTIPQLPSASTRLALRRGGRDGSACLRGQNRTVGDSRRWKCRCGGGKDSVGATASLDSSLCRSRSPDLFHSLEDGRVAKFIAYHVVGATSSAQAGELTSYRQRVEQLLGKDGVLLAEIIEKFSQLPSYVRLKYAVRSAWNNHAKLLVTGIRSQNQSPHITNQDGLWIVDVRALGRSQLRQFLLQHRKEKPKSATSARSSATKVGLEKARSRGAVLGNPLARAQQPRASKAASEGAERFRAQLRIRILEDHREGLSLRAIASKLNSEGMPTARGRAWHASSVSKILTEAKEGTT